ncbi:hypothetical protein SLS58_002608 [Diplodia intermedia]|uniref:Apple domain-containing protein n=1 Tax=Diplodia intermedia TaxID=856260 RepID=A0ABR3TZM0_9PEZI
MVQDAEFFLECGVDYEENDIEFPEGYKISKRAPIQGVSFNECVEFCARLCECVSVSYSLSAKICQPKSGLGAKVKASRTNDIINARRTLPGCDTSFSLSFSPISTGPATSSSSSSSGSGSGSVQTTAVSPPVTTSASSTTNMSGSSTPSDSGEVTVTTTQVVTTTLTLSNGGTTIITTQITTVCFTGSVHAFFSSPISEYVSNHLSEHVHSDPDGVVPIVLQHEPDHQDYTRLAYSNVDDCEN